VVECTRDPLADRIAADVAAVAGDAAAVVVDPFKGSANTLAAIALRLRTRQAVGFELDDGVFEQTRRNLALVDTPVTVYRTDHETGLAALEPAADELVVVFLAPPWGDALDPAAGLDLRYERVVPASLSEVRSRFAWSALHAYDIDPPGRNHGVLLGTLGWTP
jgi:hypothetical protein